MRNVVGKKYEGKQKKKMIGHANNQAPTLGPTQNFKHISCKLEDK